MVSASSNPYNDIVRWNGGGGNALVNYTDIHTQLSTPAIANGDEWKVVKVGNTITCYTNGVQTNTGDVSSAAANVYGPSIYPRGYVGIGFFQRSGTQGNLLEFGAYNIVITAP
jgi:hypothetical protein